MQASRAHQVWRYYKEHRKLLIWLTILGKGSRVITSL